MPDPMNIDRSVETEKEATATADIVLHPLVILNVTDHFTRQRVNHDNKPQRVIGALVGVQTGRKVEIHTSFELVYDNLDGAIVIDTKYLIQKRDQFSQVFPTYEILGWYTSGTALSERDQLPHKAIMEYNESPLLLLVNCEPTAETRDLPVYVYETVLQIIDEMPVTSFAKIPYRIESEESERISVDHITHLESSTAGDVSSLVKQLGGLKDAVYMLQQRVKLIATYLTKVKQGEHPRDHALLRMILSLCHKLPAMDSEKFNLSYQNEYHDTLLISYLGTLTKGCNVLNELVDKFNFATERSRRRGFF
jgi:COP9 signalosome complex subunit 6|uniref:COP9 signalosome complex subunit 6 n=1 Tax=Eutreptiella gymnastica TaxID=73025 RepID=A0A7S4G725_9EUGL